MLADQLVLQRGSVHVNGSVALVDLLGHGARAHAHPAINRLERYPHQLGERTRRLPSVGWRP